MSPGKREYNAHKTAPGEASDVKLDRSSMLYGTAILTAISIVSQVLGFVYRIFLSRLVGAEVMGLYQLVMPVYSLFLSMTSVGLTAAVSYLSSEYHALGDSAAAGRVLRRCLGFFLALFVPVAAVTLLGSDPISVYLLGDARTQLGLLLLLPCLLLTGIENLHKHFFYGGGNVRPPAAVELCEQFIRTAAVLLLLLLFLPQNPERTVGLIVLGMCCSEVFSSVTLVLLYRARRPPAAPAPPGLNRRIAAVALPVAATALLGNLMGSATAVLIPQRLVHAGLDVSQAMSAFGVVCGMTLPMLCLPTCFIGALGLLLSPRLAQSRALGRTADICRQLGGALRSTSLLIMPALAMLVVAGPSLGTLLFREPTAGRYILPLAVGVLFSCYQAVLSSALNGLGRQASSARSAILCGAVQLLCTWLLMGLRGVGLSGYVAGFVASSVLGALLNWREVSRASGLRLHLFSWCAAPALAALLAASVTALLLRVLRAADLGEVPAILVCLLFGLVLYLAALCAQGVLPCRGELE